MRQTDLRGGPCHDDRREHRAGARNVQHAQRQAETETVGALHDALLRNTRERLFQQLFEAREDQARPIATSATSATQRMASCGRCSKDSSAEPSRVTKLKLNTNPAITR